MRADEDIIVRRAFRGVLVSAGLCVVGTPVTIAAGLRVAHMPKWPSIAVGALALVITIVLLVRRRSMTVRLAASTFVVITSALAVSYWILGAHYIGSAEVWAPFEARKLLSVTVALVAPELWSGIIAIVGFTGGAIVQYALLSPDLTARLSISEPWTTVAFGLLGLVLHVHHQRQRAVELAMVRSTMESEATTRMARSFVAIRDLANSPLQTIALTCAALKIRAPQLVPALERIDRALDRLRQLKETLDAYQGEIDWSEHESFDAKTHLDGSRTTSK